MWRDHNLLSGEVANACNSQADVAEGSQIKADDNNTNLASTIKIENNFEGVGVP